MKKYLLATTALAIFVSGDAFATEPQNTVQCRPAWLWPCPSDDVWNIPVGSGAQYGSKTDARANAVHGAAVLNTHAWSMTVLKGNDPISIEGRGIMGVAGEQPTDGRDRHMAWVQPDDSTSIEAWHTEGGPTAYTSPYVRELRLRERCIADRPGVLAGTRASGVSNVAGLIREWEMRGDNEPRHALAIAIPWTSLRNGFVWPASAQDTDGSRLYSGPVPMGTKFAIPWYVDVDAMGLNPYGVKVAQALRRFGAIVVDQAGDSGGGVYFYGEKGLEHEIAEGIRANLSTIVDELVVIENVSREAPGGGGVAMAALAPGFCDPSAAGTTGASPTIANAGGGDTSGH